jgi:hypothetical protein
VSFLGAKKVMLTESIRNAMQCNAMQCNAMQCNAMQCNAIAYIDLLSDQSFLAAND